MSRPRRAEVDAEGHETDKSAGPKNTEGDSLEGEIREGEIREVDARVFDPLLLKATNALVPHLAAWYADVTRHDHFGVILN